MSQHLQQSIQINVSLEKVFDYLIEVNNRKDFIPAMEEVILLDPPPIKAGSRYIEIANIAGRRLETTYEVVVFEVNKRISAKTLKSVFPIQADLLLTKNGKNTKLTIQLDVTLRGVFRLTSPLISTIVQNQALGILNNIKQKLEENNLKG